jgi:CRP-like cAMP-binding protein
MSLLNELKRVRFFKNLGDDHVTRVAGLAQIKECPEGDVLFREREDSPFIYFVLSGNVHLDVEVADGDSVGVYAAGPGELVGWSPVLGRRGMTATARAATRCRLAALETDRLLQLCEEDPLFAVAFLRQVSLVLSERLASTRRRVGRPSGARAPLGVTRESSD